MRRSLLDDIEHRFEDMRRELMSSFDDASPWTGAGAARQPAVDLIDDANEFVLAVELPGVKKEDIKLDIEENAVRIRAERKESKEQKGKGFLRRERSSAQYERYLGLPEQVSPEGARARFNNGILEVTIPKTSPEKRRARAIEID